MVVLSILFSGCWSLCFVLLSTPILFLFSVVVSYCPSFRIELVWILQNIVLLPKMILGFLYLSVGSICWLHPFFLCSVGFHLVIWCVQAIPILFGKILTSFCRPCSLRFPVLLGLILIFVYVVPLFRVSQLLYRPAILVFGGRVFGLFSPERWWVCRLVRKHPLGIGSIRWFSLT